MAESSIRTRPIPIYTTPGDFEAFMIYPMLYNLRGEWIGWVTQEREVYSIHGEYVGWISKDPRILRKRTYDFEKPKKRPPASPPKMVAPSRAPLAPMMAELSFDTIDVLYEEPNRLHAMDGGEFRPDMD